MINFYFIPSIQQLIKQMNQNPKIRELDKKKDDSTLNIPQPSTARFYTEAKRNQTPTSSQMTDKNQHRLKLKDYLRLASITKRSNSNSSSRKLKAQSPEKTPNNEPVIQKSQSMLDPQKSLLILKHELKSDLSICLQKMNDLMYKVDKDNMKMEKSQQEYEELVFMCELHRMVKQNMMTTLDKANNMISQHRQSQLFKFSAMARQLITSDIKKSATPSRKRGLNATSRFRPNLTTNLMQHTSN